MFPIRDNIPSRTTPLVSYAIIAACSLVFLLQLGQGNGGLELIQQYGMVPLRISHPDQTPTLETPVLRQSGGRPVVVMERRPMLPAKVTPLLTMVTCIFLHGGWMHILGNMWFLYIFGDNVEDRLGHLGFALLYLVTGVLASAAHFLASPESSVPTIGASGAIAGVMGAYAWLYPHAKVQAVLPIFIILQVFIVPAPVFLGIWFIFQTVSGLADAGGGAGVAWWAHIGGFVAGIVIAVIVGRSPLGHAAVHERRF
ncbi:rhomboid family intramembrane serine protease [Roseiconus nitratireducens]|uniref:Rhomboid family intramembrane serine protease n=1 Tax=Roseiconus nitratireducens TaxID=2605748 RepID=A0A5M6CZ40_9BACT|nr:rhomboid family intramembrane serine protease [Roseiconus nitratireducens]KAA5540481.1 rhomboid family intramembrane serine protease [Roseiconus nitratireducens]